MKKRKRENRESLAEETTMQQEKGATSGEPLQETKEEMEEELTASGSEGGEENEEIEGIEEEGEEIDPRIARLEHLFKDYPLTLALLKESDTLDIGERIITFLAGVDGFARGSGLPRQEIDASLRMLFSIVKGYSEGTLDLDILEVILKGLGYDRQLEEERKAAEERGRKAGMQSKLRLTRESDGVPNLGRKTIRKESSSLGIFSLAATAR